MARDQRRHGRKKLNDDFIVFDQFMNQKIGRIANLSMRGVMKLSEDPVEMPSVFSCRVQLPRMINGCDQFEFDAQAKWCKRNNANGLYETGYEFVKLTSDNEKLVKTILETWDVLQQTSKVATVSSDQPVVADKT